MNKNSFLSQQSLNFQNFFQWSENYIAKNNKKIILVNTRNISHPSGKCSGWCDGEEIVVATKNPLFQQVFVHEFSHMNQAVENSLLWKDDFIYWDLLEQKKLNCSNFDSVMDVIALERDCESRALKYSKRWGLFDNEIYAKNANLYLFYYQFTFLQNKWYDSTTIYHPYLLKEMPTKLLTLESFRGIDMDLMDLFYQCLDKKGKFYKKL